MRGDLDNIVLTALRADPVRRYPGSDQLAEDLRRHLERKPVHARPDTPGYRARRFLVRNRAGVIAAALLLASLLGGLAATTHLARVATAERRRAERRFHDVRQLAHVLLFEVNDALERRGPTPARQLLVQRGLEYLDRLATESHGDAGLQRELASAYQKVGDVQSRLHVANLGDTTGARLSYGKALALRETLTAAHPGDASFRHELARDHGRFGDILSKTGDSAGALAAYRRSVSLLAATPPADRAGQGELARMRDRLGCILHRTGDIPGAGRELLAGRAIRAALAASAPADEAEAAVDLARSDCSLAFFYGTEGRAAEALALLQHNAEVFRRAAGGADSGDGSGQRLVMEAREWLGLGLADVGDLAGSLTELRAAGVLGEESLARDPANVQARNDLGDILHETGDTLLRLGEAPAARDHYRRAVEHYRAVAESDPVNVHARRQLAHAEGRLAVALGRCGEAAEGVATLQKLLPCFEERARGDPPNLDFQRDVAGCLLDLGEELRTVGDLPAGRRALLRAGSLYESLATRVPSDARVAANLATLRARLAAPGPAQR